MIPEAYPVIATAERRWPKVLMAAAVGLAAMSGAVIKYVGNYQEAEQTRILPAQNLLSIEPLPTDFGVISWNIHAGKTPLGEDNIPEVEDFLSKQSFIMAGLQEVPRVAVPKIMGRLGNYMGIFDPTYVPVAHPDQAQGNLILLSSSVAPEKAMRAVSKQLHHPKPKLIESLLPRSMTLVTVDKGPNTNFVFGTTHLEALNSQVGRQQATQGNQFIRQHSPILSHLIFTADINASVKNSATSKNLAGNLTAYSPQNASFGANSFIDGVFSDLRINNITSMGSGNISDHKMVYGLVHQRADSIL